MKEQIILIGGGGHCKACIDVIEQAGKFQIAGIVDIPEKMHDRIWGYEVIATDNDLPKITNEYKNILITVGQIHSSEKRIRLFETIKELGAKLPVVVSPLAYVSRHAAIDEGSIIMHHAIVNANAKIGKNCIINTKSLIEHDAVIGDHCHISTGAIINGGVEIGRGSFFGSGAVSKEYVSISSYSFVKANTIVQKSEKKIS